MRVIKRDGRKEDVSFDKVIKRLEHLCSGKTYDGQIFGKPLDVDIIPLAQKVINEIRDGITTRQLDEFAASTCADLVMDHPDYAELAGRISISNHQKNTLGFVATIKLLYQNTDKQGNPNPLIAPSVYKTILQNKMFFEKMIDDNRDYSFNYFAFKTLERAYLLKSQSGHLTVMERPQHTCARVAVGIWGNDLKKVKMTYDLLSMGMIMHATPTLFNSGRPTNQFSSCFLLHMEDSITGIYETLKKCALISKNAGGIGIAASDVRAKRSLIRGTHGVSDGIVPMLKVYDQTANYVNQGGKRKGSFAIYLEPWHADVIQFLDLRKTHGNLDFRANYLFYALWIPDLFMKRLKESITTNNKKIMWSLMCPDECPGLTTTYGDEFERLYTKYEAEGRYREQIPIQDITRRVLASQKETGTPYMVYKDNVNRTSNQKNLGTIKSSNLCVAPETRILTEDGYFEIEDLNNQEVKVWNGQFFSKSRVQKTGHDQELLELEFSNGTILKCTRYHKFYLESSDNPVQVTAETLKIGDNLQTPEAYPTLIDGDDYAHYGPDEVPTNGNFKTKMRWLGKYLDRQGLVVNQTVQIRVNGHAQPEKMNLLNEVRLMLTTLGVSGYLDRSRATLTVYPKDIHHLRSLGLESQILSRTLLDQNQLPPRPPVKLLGKRVIVDRRFDTYCFNEPARHQGIFEGLLAGNCAEIVEYSNATEELIAVCNLASIPVNKYVKVSEEKEEKIYSYDHEGLGKAVEVLVENLNRIIDVNYYPVEDCAKSNRRDRPIGIGIQGLADAFILMRYPFDSPEARKLNREIAETMYYYAVKTSVRLAKETGETYTTFKGSPASEGIFHWEMWNELRQSRSPPLPPTPLTDRYDWEGLRKEMVTHGLKNSLLLAMMPTASTAQILGNNECIEPYTYNVYVRRVLSGEFKIVNPHLQRDLYEQGLWTDEIRKDIIRHKGSIQQISEIPNELKALYKTSFEIKPSVIMNLAADRQAFVDQSQSMNLFISNPDDDLLITIYLYGWEQGLNTGLYYLRREAISSAQQFTVKPVKVPTTKQKKIAPQDDNEEKQSENGNILKQNIVEGDFCRKDDPDCLACQG